MKRIGNRLKGHISRNWGFYMVLSVFACIICYLWISKALTDRNHRIHIEAMIRAEHESMEAVHDSIVHDYALLLTQSVGWKVRDELMRGNREHLGLYLNELVQSDYISKVSYTDAKGIILYSTDKGEMGKGLERNLLEKSRSIHEVAMVEVNDKSMYITPLISVDKRSGNLVIQFNMGRLIKSES